MSLDEWHGVGENDGTNLPTEVTRAQNDADVVCGPIDAVSGVGLESARNRAARSKGR